jgi:hypothetical protein
MKHSNSFYYDLNFGEQAEDWVKSLFTGGLKVEIKSDRRSSETGNIFIEVYSRDKKSGISTTNADYWIYRVDDNDSAFIVSTQRLKNLVKLNFNGTFVKGGDNNTSLGVLIPIKNLL